MDDFSASMEKNVGPEDTIIVGVSGGPDSMYLLERCLDLQKRVPFRIIVAHVNHGLRGKDSDGDERFVALFCKKHRIPFKVKRIKKGVLKTKKNLEEAAREARYLFFEKLRKNSEARWIVTAHHLNDNIETMLFNLIRGAHFNGIKGMETANRKRHILRPLLGITKKEILENLKKHRTRYRLDASNENPEFSRNWLRKKIIPLFPKINPNFEQTFRDTLKNFAQTSNYLEQQCEHWLLKNEKKNGIELDTFLKEHSAFQKHLLAHLYKKFHGSTKKLANKHLEEILNVLGQRQAGKKKEFGPRTFLEVSWEPRGKTTKKRYIRLSIQK